MKGRHTLSVVVAVAGDNQRDSSTCYHSVSMRGVNKSRQHNIGALRRNVVSGGVETLNSCFARPGLEVAVSRAGRLFFLLHVKRRLRCFQECLLDKLFRCRTRLQICSSPSLSRRARDLLTSKSPTSILSFSTSIACSWDSMLAGKQQSPRGGPFPSHVAPALDPALQSRRGRRAHSSSERPQPQRA